MRRLKTEAQSWHVFARGARRLLLFYKNQDYAVFLNLLREAVDTSGCLLWAYCLMSNHFHLVLRGSSSQLTRCMWLLNRRYALYHNREYHLGGHVFEGPYKAYLQRSHFFLIRTIIYVFLNPVAAGMADRPEDYQWSGYRSFMGLEGSPLPLDPNPVYDLLRPHVADCKTWVQWLVEERIKLLPHHPSPDPASAVQVQSQQFRWLLEQALLRKDRIGGENPTLVALFWGHQAGIPPRAMAAALGNCTGEQVKWRLRRYERRVEGNPTLRINLQFV